MSENDLTLQCWGYKEDGSEYCSNHCQFPNLGVNAKVYGDDCKRLSEPCSLQSFIERFYPGANKDSYPRHADEFLTYIKCMSGCDDLWEVFGCSPPVLAYVKNIVGMISSSGEDPKERAAQTNKFYRRRARHFVSMLQMQASRLQPNTKASAMQSHVSDMFQHTGTATTKHLSFHVEAVCA